MKSYIKICILGVGLSSLSCNKFLDNEPLSDFTGEPQQSISLQSQYKSVTDAQSALKGAYDKFKQDIFQFENFSYGDIQSDNCYAGGDGVPGEEIAAVKVSSLNSKVKLIWSQYYEMGGAATAVIENAKLMRQGIDDATKKSIIAEAKFIRAYAYFDIVRIWGDAPLMVELIPPITSDNLTKPPKTKSTNKLSKTSKKLSLICKALTKEPSKLPKALPMPYWQKYTLPKEQNQRETTAK